MSRAARRLASPEREEADRSSGRILAGNVLWNLLGQSTPLAIAVVAVPLLIHRLGTDRFGILALVWTVIGYFSFFDLGVGRALTQLVAQHMGLSSSRDIGGLGRTSLVLLLCLGVASAVLTIALSPWVVRGLLRIPSGLQRETLQAFALMALSIPIVTVSTGLRGILEAHQLFRLSNAVRLPLGAATFVAPLVVSVFSRSLVAIVASLVVARLAAGVSYGLLAVGTMPSLKEGRLSFKAVIPVLRSGGWMTISNLLSPVLVYMDRFLIGSVISVAAVAYYATPYEAVTKLWILPAALSGVLFPAFSASFAGQRARTLALFERGLKYVFLAMFPLTLGIVEFAKAGLSVWLGRDFALHSSAILQWLAIGVLANSVGQIAFSFIQGVGRSDLTAKINLLEVPVYVPALLWLVAHYGAEGAAVAWTGRVILDLILLGIGASRILYVSLRSWRFIAGAVLPSLILAGAWTPSSLTAKSFYYVIGLGLFGLVAWFLLLSRDERRRLSLLPRFLGF